MVSANTIKWRHLLAIVTIVCLVAFIVYFATNYYVIKQAENDTRDILFADKGIHEYVQRIMHPALYTYQEKDEIQKNFYAPELFSSSFIVRNTHQFYNEERKRAGLPPIYYKMASLNPRNPVNQADEREKELIGMFNANKELKEYYSIVESNGEKYLYYAQPFLRNTKACLVCHGKREDAPLQLQELYNGQGGFGEKVGDIRAIISLRVPFQDVHNKILIISLSLISGLAAFILLLFFNRKLSKKVSLRTESLTKEIAERQQTAAKLIDSERRLNSVLETLPMGVWFTDRDGLILYGNPAAQKIWQGGRYIKPDQFHEYKAWKISTGEPVTADQWAVARAIHNNETTIEEELEIECFDGTRKFILNWAAPLHDSEGNITGALAVNQDISDRVKGEQQKLYLEKQLRQAQKMEAVGTLAGGIAHDFNNILSIIINASEIIQDEIPAESPVRYYNETVMKAAHRAKELTRQILAFSRQSELKFAPVHLASLIKETLQLLRSTIPASIEIHQDIDPACGFINADPVQIHQVVMNLCANAVHAMDENGILTIRLEENDLAQKDILHQPGFVPGRYIHLEVADTGCGMDQYTLNRIFEPFFTTKQVGQGTGMGLSVVHGIVETHRGFIKVNSTVGEGTSFNLFFPKIEAEPKVKNDPPVALPGCKERILFVDDEELVAKLGGTILEQLGYQVTTKTHSGEALAAVQAKPDAFDLVITDQTMPAMTGSKLAEALLQIRPDMPIILCTGYSNKISAEDAGKLGIKAFLLKPIDRRLLAETVRRVLDEHSPQGKS